MQIPQAIRQQACEGLLHFVPKKALARELGISRGSVRDWAIYIEHGFFDWIDKTWRTRRPELMQKAVDFWFENYPIGCSDVAKRFGIRHAALFRMIERAVATLPEQLRPKRIRYWDAKPETSLETFRMRIEKLSDIPADRPLSLKNARLFSKKSRMREAALSARNRCSKSLWKTVGTNAQKPSPAPMPLIRQHHRRPATRLASSSCPRADSCE